MKIALREFLRRRLSPQSYQHVRGWWRCRLYWPSLAASYLVQGRPLVRGFPSGRDSDLVHELRAVNVLAPTEMCRVMNRHGSDKGVGRPAQLHPGLLCTFRTASWPAVPGFSNLGWAATMQGSPRTWGGTGCQALHYADGKNSSPKRKHL